MEFTKDFFQTAWGAEGYYEDFSYGVGIEKVCDVALYPFLNKSKYVLEIGPGGGTFTQRIAGKVKHLTAIDVIKKPPQFERLQNMIYIELDDKDYSCKAVSSLSFDFAFCYNVFCHFPEEAISEYLKGVYGVLKTGGDFVFMIANYEHSKKHFVDSGYKRNDMLPIGHFYQDLTTINHIAGKEWKIVNPNLIPEHRDIIIHLRK